MIMEDLHPPLLGGDADVAGEEVGLDIEGERVDVDKDNLARAFGTGENTTLSSGTVDDGPIGVDFLRGLLAAEVFLEKLLNLVGGTTNKNDLGRIRGNGEIYMKH